jgi:hypothetical protein
MRIAEVFKVNCDGKLELAGHVYLHKGAVSAMPATADDDIIMRNILAMPHFVGAKNRRVTATDHPEEWFDSLPDTFAHTTYRHVQFKEEK